MHWRPKWSRFAGSTFLPRLDWLMFLSGILKKNIVCAVAAAFRQQDGAADAHGKVGGGVGGAARPRAKTFARGRPHAGICAHATRLAPIMEGG